VLASILVGIAPLCAAEKPAKVRTSEAAAAGAAKSKADGGIVVVVNNEVITAYQIEQRARFMSLSSNIGDKVKENFHRLAQQESTNNQLRALLQEVLDKNRGKTQEQIRAIFEERKKQFSLNLQRQAVESARASLVPQMRKAAQEELIEECLKVAEAKKMGIEITDDDVKRVVKNISDNNKMTEEQFSQHLESLGVKIFTLKDRFRAMLAWREVIRRRFSALVSVTQREVDKAVSESVAQTGEDTVELQVQKIALSLPLTADQTAMAKRFVEAEALRRKFSGCKGMAEVAKSAGAKFEDMKYVKPSSIAEPTRSLLLSAKDGDILPPSAAPGAIELFAVCNRRTVKAADSAREKAQEDLRAKEFERLAKSYLRDIRQDAHIEFR
jgi:peptidyl-prolyl cis-trans isomerase SurA